MTKIGRNEHCPCGSGLKYKKCCSQNSIQHLELQMPSELKEQINSTEIKWNYLSSLQKSEMKRIPISQSYFPQAQNVSIYHVIFPVFRIDEKAKPLELLGSCCAIGSGGLYISSAHLFKPFSDIKHERQKPDILQNKLTYQQDELRVGVLKFHGEGAKTAFRLFPVQNLNLFTEHDIALFWIEEFEMPPSNQPRLPICETPIVGKKIKIIGYPGIANSFTPSKDKKATSCISLVESEGIITKLYPDGRDLGHAWFPCIETSARMAAGHSGGAALDFNFPALIGTNSVSGDENSSLVSWVGKILDEEIGIAGLLLTRNDGVQISVEKTSLRKLAEFGVVSIV